LVEKGAFMIYIATDDGALPIVLVRANNKIEAKNKVYSYYKSMITDVLKKDIYIHNPDEYFEEDEDVVEIPMS
jgi:hypothetical protein